MHFEATVSASRYLSDVEDHRVSKGHEALGVGQAK